MESQKHLFEFFKSKIFTLLVTFIILFPAIAQEKANNSWNLKIGYSRINNYSLQLGNIGEFSVEGNYRVNKWLETGLYTGFTTCQVWEDYFNTDGILIGRGGTNAFVLSYGVNAYFNLSSLFFGENFRLGIRAIMKPGGIIVFTNDGYEPKGHYFTFRPGVGNDYRIFKKM
jgi:hypothetical protein